MKLAQNLSRKTHGERRGQRDKHKLKPRKEMAMKTLILTMCLCCQLFAQELNLFSKDAGTPTTEKVDLSLFSPLTEREIVASKSMLTADPMFDLFSPTSAMERVTPANDLKLTVPNVPSVPPPLATQGKPRVYYWSLETGCEPCLRWRGERNILDREIIFVDGSKVWPVQGVKTFPTFLWKTNEGDWKRIEGYHSASHLMNSVFQTRTLPKNTQPTKASAEEPTDRRVNLKLTEDDLNADTQPTPMPGVIAMLNALKPQPNEVLIDPGCGFDARVLITAVRDFGTKKAIGIEIDPEIAASARAYVADSGYSDRITIINGDSTKLNWNANIGAAYLWPDTLGAMRAKIQGLDRFVSFAFATPALNSKENKTEAGVTYLWTKDTESRNAVPIVRTFNGIVNLPRGSYCQICGRYCSNPMAHKLQQQVVGYK